MTHPPGGITLVVVALVHWLQLSLVSGMGPVLIRRLVEVTGSAEAAVRAGEAELRAVEGMRGGRLAEIRRGLAEAAEAAEQQIQLVRQMGVRIICIDDAEYPPLLAPLADAPPVLYLRGQLQPRDLQSLAIVGSRRCSHYGREQAERFGSLLAGSGFTVISGGARGIDSCAHRGALRQPQGRTVAVLGCGLDVTYPPENAELFGQIAARGAVISEFPLGTPPNAENFPRRNRIVSGMARGVLVVEADLRSGALITARLANEEHGRPVFAVPGRVDSPTSAGTHQLIRDGAVLAANLEDICSGLGPVPDSARQGGLFDTVEVPVEHAPPAGEQAAPASAARTAALTDRQRKIMEQLGGDPASVERIIEGSALPATEVLAELTFLSLKGFVRRVDGQTYVRGARAQS